MFEIEKKTNMSTRESLSMYWCRSRASITDYILHKTNRICKESHGKETTTTTMIANETDGKATDGKWAVLFMRNVKYTKNWAQHKYININKWKIFVSEMSCFNRNNRYIYIWFADGMWCIGKWSTKYHTVSFISLSLSAQRCLFSWHQGHQNAIINAHACKHSWYFSKNIF